MFESEFESTQNPNSRKRLSLRRFEKVNNPLSIHGIYPYRGKMSPLDAMHVIKQLPPNTLLLDPFCGTGTILYEAQAHGLNAIGVDSNPLACTIARGKTEPLNKEAAITQIENAIEEAKSLSEVDMMPSQPAKYFHKKTADQIMRLLALSDSFTAYNLSSYYGAICLAARACNNWLWTSTSVGRINKPLKNIDFYSTILRKARKHIEFVKGTPQVTVHTHDTRKLSEIVRSKSVDVVYTSPPYFDALDYTGYYSKIVLEILDINRAEIREGLIQRYSTYQEEMMEALQAIDQVLHDESLVIFVVGDRLVRKKFIRGAEFFDNISPWKDPYIVEREYTKTASSI
ncbi:MAG: DNA adenine methylase [Candidatus Thorarchaeota archaeon]|nr:DNA adenine methylase [Candidatus Thorarchaeota archaeon]